MKTADDIKHQFNAVKCDQVQQHKMMLITNSFAALADEVLVLLPEGKGRDCVLNRLLGAKMWAIQEVSHNTPVPAPKPAPPQSGKKP